MITDCTLSESHKWFLFFIDFAKGENLQKRVEELNYKYSKRLQVDLL